MRSFGVTAYFYIGRQFVKSQSSACYSMIQHPTYIIYNNEKLKRKNYGNYMRRKFVYIADFNEPETIEYQKLIISAINEITPCEMVQKDNQFFIKFKLLGTYDQSLILLSFIRNLWHEPTKGYSKRFFEALKIATQEDPLEKLTWANKEACTDSHYCYGHSNYHRKSDLKIKKSKQLLEYKGFSTRDFLTV